MPWNSPTLQENAEQTRSDMRARIPGARPELRRSLLRVIADMVAGAVQGIYGYIDFLARQILPDTAEGEYLERWAGIWRVERKAAARAGGTVIFTGDDGVTIPSERRLEADDGSEYETDESAEIEDGEAQVSVTALDAGEDGNQDADTELTLVSALAGIDSTAVVGEDGLTGGAEAERDPRLRERFLDRIRRPPHGGDEDDWERWTLESHPDITRAWVYPHEPDDGVVTVRAVCDDLDDIIPTSEVIDAIEANVDKQRPVTAKEFYAIAPEATPLNPAIRLTPDTTEVRERVEEAIEDFLSREAKPGGTIYREDLSGVIYVASGDSRHELDSPADDVEHGKNEIAVLGEITWL